MLQIPAQTAIDEYVFLIGRPPIGEFIGFVRSMTLNGHQANQGQLMDEWRNANNHLTHIEQVEAGLADNPPIQSVPDELKPLEQQVYINPIFQQAFQSVPTSLGIVELDRLVVYQKFINLGFVNQLKNSLGPNPNTQDVFRIALGIDRDLPPFRFTQTAPNVYTFISPSNDFRFLEPVVLDPRQIQNFSPTGPASAVIGLSVGYGSNYLNAIYIGNRLVLNNGSHRAYALRDLGVTHVPCLIQRISQRDELEMTGPVDVLQNPDRYLNNPRPPMLKDYFDQMLRKLVPVPRKNRLVKITFGVEQTDIPAA